MLALPILAVLAVTPATWAAQLKAAQPGDTLVLTGAFPALMVASRQGLTLDLTAASAPRLIVRGSSDVAVKGGRYAPADSYGGVYVSASTRVKVSGVRVDGTGVWPGVTFRDSGDVALDGARIDRARVGVNILNVTGARISSVELLGYTVDGLDIGAGHQIDVGYVTCAGAQLQDNHHPDCIQLLGTVPGAEPTSDVRLHDLMISGATQGVGGYDHGTGGFRNITVERAAISVSYPQAVALNAAPGSVVRDVRVFTLPGAPYRASINVDATVLRCGNVVAPGAGKPGVVDAPCAP